MVVSMPRVAATLLGGLTSVLSTVGGGGDWEHPATISEVPSANVIAIAARVRDLMCVSPVGVPDPRGIGFRQYALSRIVRNLLGIVKW
jgi:hypothetical protein